MNNKSYSMLLMVFVFGILLIGSVSASAADWDNVKRYDEETKTVTIKNTFGLGADIAMIKLDTPLNNKVGMGYQKVAQITIYNYEDYSNPLKEMEFYNKISMDSIERNFDYKYKTIKLIDIEDYETSCSLDKNGTNICTPQLIGTHKESREEWKDLDDSTLLRGDITIGIFTDVQRGDYVEWIPTYYGVKINEWATWTEDLNTNLLHYYNLEDNNDSLGTANLINQGGVTFTPGLIGKGANGGIENNGSHLNTTDTWDLDGGIVSISVWVNATLAPTVDHGILGTCNDASDVCYLLFYDDGGGTPEIIWDRLKNGVAGSSVTHPTTLPLNGSYQHIVGIHDGTNNFLYFNGVMVGKTASSGNGSVNPIVGSTIMENSQTPGRRFNGKIDEVGIWNRNLTQAEVTQLYNGGVGITLDAGPLIILNSPADNLETTNNSIFFNGTVISRNFKTIVNVSLIIDGVVNETNSSGINNSEYIFTKTLSFDTHNWTYESCDNSSVCFTASTRDFEILTFIENNITFTSEVLETSSQEFELNITTISEILSVSAFLNYNGTRHFSNTLCSESNCTITNTIDIPLTFNLESENKSFFWEITAFDGTTSVSTNTSENEQNVSRIHLEECDATFTTQALNFTVYDEQNLTRINEFLFDATFDQWLGRGSVKRKISFTNSSLSEEALCILPGDDTFFIDAIIEYDEAGNESIYTLRNYFFQNDTISNSSQDIFMYLLKSSSSTSFILKVQDDSLLPVSGVLIEINRFYPGTDEFRIVQIARTDDSGKSVGFFETEIVDYKFLITLDNETLLETGIQKVIPESSPFTLTFNIGDPLGKPWSSQEPIDDLNSSLVWDDDSGFVTYIYIDSSTFFSLGRLLVIKESLVNQSNNTILCNVNSSFSAATLICNVSSTNGFYAASSFITRNSTEQLDRLITFQIETLSGVVGLLGLFYGWFIILIASFMFKFNEIAGIWAVTITVFFVNLMGLISFGGVFVTATIAIALILTWIMER